MAPVVSSDAKENESTAIPVESKDNADDKSDKSYQTAAVKEKLKKKEPNTKEATTEASNMMCSI
jgi:hypothetical protein